MQNSSEYISVQYERSHLQSVSLLAPLNPHFDSYDLLMVCLTVLFLIVTILTLINDRLKERFNSKINIELDDKKSNEIPFFIAMKQGKRDKRETKEVKARNRMEHKNSDNGSTELRCLKCNESFEIKEKNLLNKINIAM